MKNKSTLQRLKIILDCGPPIAPSNSNVTFVGTKFGNTAVVHCETGYQIDGATDTMTCESNGMWSSGIVCAQIGKYV